MKKVNLYLGELKLTINPQNIRFSVDGRSKIYDLAGLGEACILQGAKLAKIDISGYFGEQAQSATDYLKDKLEKKKPLRLVYTGENFDVNMEVSVAKCTFEQTGGSNDVTFSVALQKYVPVTAVTASAGKGENSKEVGSATKEQTPTSYVVQKGDTLSHIARHALGDSRRWKEIFDCNPSIKNPNLIFPGQELVMPDGSVSYVPKRPPSSGNGSNTVTVKPPTNDYTGGDKLQQDLQDILDLGIR